MHIYVYIYIGLTRSYVHTRPHVAAPSLLGLPFIFCFCILSLLQIIPARPPHLCFLPFCFFYSWVNCTIRLFIVSQPAVYNLNPSVFSIYVSVLLQTTPRRLPRVAVFYSWRKCTTKRAISSQNSSPSCTLSSLRISRRGHPSENCRLRPTRQLSR